MFKQLFAANAGTNKLTLTFINALVDDLSLELHGISEVKTLHGYALSKLPEDKVKIFPGMQKIIREDANILVGEDIDFTKKIHEIDETDGHLDFYSSRRKYYGHFDYEDVIFVLVRTFQQRPDAIPAYSQIVVDEFQDFSQLEVELINLLARKSSILIAGDDDQAIYNFKNAHSKFIREFHGTAKPEYVSFTLPFCSRSTKVIVEAVNDLVQTATARGFLDGRIDKRYEYFTCPDKDKESDADPKIIHHRLEDAQIPWFISKELDKIAKQRREKFDVLIISPFRDQRERIGRSLIKKGLRAVEFRETSPQYGSYLEGLKLLTRRRIGHDSNLGWRIASHAKLSNEQFSETLGETQKNSSNPFRSVVPREIRDEIERDVELLRKVRDDEAISNEELDELLEGLSLDQNEIKANYVRNELLDDGLAGNEYPAIKKIPITATTIQSSKGLAAEYVFITHFDQRYIPGANELTDNDICNVLVALTRARKKVWLLSTTDEPCVFLDWIDGCRVQRGA